MVNSIKISRGLINPTNPNDHQATSVRLTLTPQAIRNDKFDFTTGKFDKGYPFNDVYYFCNQNLTSIFKYGSAQYTRNPFSGDITVVDGTNSDSLCTNYNLPTQPVCNIVCTPPLVLDPVSCICVPPDECIPQDCPTTTPTPLPTDLKPLVNGYAFYVDYPRMLPVPGLGEIAATCWGGHGCCRTNFQPRLILDNESYVSANRNISMNNTQNCSNDGQISVPGFSPLSSYEKSDTFQFIINPEDLFGASVYLKCLLPNENHCHTGVTMIVLVGETLDGQSVLLFSSCISPGSVNAKPIGTIDCDTDINNAIPCDPPTPPTPPPSPECKLVSGFSVPFVDFNSGSSEAGGNETPCSITPEGMSTQGVLANTFIASNISAALDEVGVWLSSLGYNVNTACNGCTVIYPEYIGDSSPGWQNAWPNIGVGSGVATSNNIDTLQITYPNINIGDCYLFRTPPTGLSPCDTDPETCDYCCDLFYAPSVTIQGSCCDNDGALGPLVSFTGTIAVGPSYQINTVTNTANQACDGGDCDANIPYTNDFTITYDDNGYMIATARLCRNTSCCIGPSAASEDPSLGPSGTCSYVATTQTECECRDLPKKLCCILHTREVKGSLNGGAAADLIEGIYTVIGENDETDYCPGGVYMDVALEYNPNYGSGDYRIDRYNLAYQYYKSSPEVLPGWENISGNYVFTGSGLGSDVVLTLGGGWPNGNSNKEYTWSPAGSLNFGPNVEVSESAPGDPYYCKWKGVEYYYEWKWVALADNNSCGAPSGNADFITIANAQEPTTIYCNNGTDACLSVNDLVGAGGKTFFPLPQFNTRLTINNTEQECGPQWGTWNNSVCSGVNC